VRYGDAAAFRQALEQRLRTRAAGDGARLARDRKRVAFDRLLARLVEAAPERWLLKGGFALDLRLSNRARTTRDVDIDWQAAEEELFDALIDAAALETDDFFAFGIERMGTPPERLGGSHRFRATAQLAGRQSKPSSSTSDSRPIRPATTTRSRHRTFCLRRHRPGRSPGRPARAADRGEAARLHSSLRQRPAELPREGQ
jgi:hypothetical protein